MKPGDTFLVHTRPPNHRERDPRLQTLEAGDPTSDYAGFDEIRLMMLHEQDELPTLEETVICETQAASDRLSAVMQPTPLEVSTSFTAELGCTVLFKREDKTPVKSFKLRGAYNQISQLSDAELAAGVITASAGNHAQGVALSARLLGTVATIVMPVTTPESKIVAVEAFGGQIELYGDTFKESQVRSHEIQAETGANYIHPFDDPDIITGQGVVALEIMQQNPEVTHIFVPVGGGGLLAGMTRYVKAVRPDIRIIGVEPHHSNAMERSLSAGERVILDSVGIFAEGAAVSQVGEQTFAAAQSADAVISVSEDELCVALADFIAETGSVLETAGALALAGLRKYARAGHMDGDSKAVAVCSGANIDNSRLAHVLEQAEKLRGRNLMLRIGLPERPGALYTLCREVINGHNIEKFFYRKRSGLSEANVSVALSTVSKQDGQRVLNLLEQTGHSFVDLSTNSLVRDQGLQMMGDEPNPEQESFYRVEFADRHGALLEFLESLGERWNISLFHYGGSSGDVGTVLIGFEGADTDELEKILKAQTSGFEPADAAVLQLLG